MQYLKERLQVKLVYLDAYFDDEEFKLSPIKYNYNVLWYRFPHKIVPNYVLKF